MENASKALIMAGSVLIALVVISLLVMFFGNLRNLQNTKVTGEQVEQVTEFNKSYDVYARNVYGSELLSVASKIEDYNKREVENKNYTPIELVVKLNTNIDEVIFKSGTYSANDLSQVVNQIDKEVKKYASRDAKDGMLYKGKGINSNKTRTISQLASMRTKDIKEFFDLKDDDTIEKEVLDKIAEYNSVKNLLSTVKQTIFLFDKFEYDTTGRVKTMIYHYR